MTMDKYVELLRWTADQIGQREGGQQFEPAPPVLAELDLEPRSGAN